MVEIIKKNILHLPNVSFGDVLGEMFIDKLIDEFSPVNYSEGRKTPFDGYIGDKKVEVKFARTLHVAHINEYNVIDVLSASNMSCFMDSDSDYDMKGFFNGVKPDEFDILFYAMMFDDIIYLFKITSEDIISSDIINLINSSSSNKSSKQFSIRNKSKLKCHIDNYLYKSFTWDEFINVLRKD